MIPLAELNPLIPHPVEIILSIVVFGLLFWLVKKYVVPSFESIYQERTTAIEGGLQEAERKQAEADRRLSELESRLSEARHEASRIREEAREQAAQIVSEAREEGRTESARLVEGAQAQIAADRQQAMASLRAEVGSLATTLAERIVGESLQDEVRRTRVVDRFLEGLAAGQEAEKSGSH